MNGNAMNDLQTLELQRGDNRDSVVTRMLEVLDTHVLWALMVAALVVRLVFFYVMFGGVPAPAQDTAKYWGIAKSLVKGDGYHLNGSPTAFILPLYPLFLAAHYSLFGEGHLPVVMIQLILNLFCVFLAFLIGREVVGRRVGVIAAALAAIYPYFFWWFPYILTETLSMLLVSLALYCYLRFDSTLLARYCIAGGVILGLAVLTRVSNAALFAAVLSWLCFYPSHFNRGRTRCFSAPVMSILTFFFVLLLWLVRNRFVLGEWVLSTQSSNILGISFYYDDYLGGRPIPLLALREFLALLARSPWNWLAQCLTRLRLIWLWPVWERHSSIHNALSAILSIGVNLGMAVAGVHWFRSHLGGRKLVLLFMLILWLTFLIVATVVDDEMRYRLPIEPAIVTCIAIAIDWVLGHQVTETVIRKVIYKGARVQ